MGSAQRLFSSRQTASHYYSASSIRIRKRRKPRPLLSIFVTGIRPIMAVEATYRVDGARTDGEEATLHSSRVTRHGGGVLMGPVDCGVHAGERRSSRMASAIRAGKSNTSTIRR